MRSKVVRTFSSLPSVPWPSSSTLDWDAIVLVRIRRFLNLSRSSCPGVRKGKLDGVAMIVNISCIYMRHWDNHSQTLYSSDFTGQTGHSLAISESCISLNIDNPVCISWVPSEGTARIVVCFSGLDRADSRHSRRPSVCRRSAPRVVGLCGGRTKRTRSSPLPHSTAGNQLLQETFPECLGGLAGCA